MTPSKEVRVAISSAGRRVGLINCLRMDAERLGRALRIVAWDVRPELSAACALADSAYAVPSCTHADFVTEVCNIVEREAVDLVIPTIDTELALFAEAVPLFAHRGARVSVSSTPCVAIARDKYVTADVLSRAGVPVPRTARLSDYFRSPDWPMPFLVKPIDGSSSIGVRTVETALDMEQFAGDADRYIAQELCVGTEYTVNMFFDDGGRLRCAIPHRRIETRGGEVSKGRTERIRSLQAISERVACALPGARGALCFQALMSAGGDPRVIEINARFGGGFPLAHRAGARFTQWLLEEVGGMPSSANDHWRAGVTMLRYDAAVFVEGNVD